MCVVKRCVPYWMMNVQQLDDERPAHDLRTHIEELRDDALAVVLAPEDTLQRGDEVDVVVLVLVDRHLDETDDDEHRQDDQPDEDEDEHHQDDQPDEHVRPDEHLQVSIADSLELCLP